MKRFLICLIGVLCLALTMGGAALADEMTWTQLQAAINDAENGSTITLQSIVLATESDGPLLIPQGKTITIDLNGHVIHRYLSTATPDGNVITNNGTLTIMSSSMVLPLSSSVSGRLKA